MSGPRRRSGSGSSLGAHAFEKRFGYTFRDETLLALARTHRSYAEEKGAGGLDNQRLELLGDAVVGLAVTHALYERHPSADEGALSRLRQRLVSTTSLAQASRESGLAEWALLGRGEERTGGRSKEKLLADLFEAVTGAIYLDGGLEPAAAWVTERLGARLDGLRPGSASRDAKTALQEWVQGNRGVRPSYVLVSVDGPAHDQTFRVAATVDGVELGRGEGSSKKSAEKAAAAAALSALTAADTSGKES